MEFGHYLQPCSAAIDLQRYSVYAPMVKPFYVFSSKGLHLDENSAQSPSTSAASPGARSQSPEIHDVTRCSAADSSDVISAESSTKRSALECPKATVSATTVSRDDGRDSGKSSKNDESRCSWSCSFDDEVIILTITIITNMPTGDIAGTPSVRSGRGRDRGTYFRQLFPSLDLE